MTGRGPIAVLLLAGALVITACAGDDTKDASSGCETVTVQIGEFRFDPTPVAIGRCDSVVWKNAHNQAHTSTGNAAMTWGTCNVEPGATSAAVVFNTAGSFAYICALHPFMKGEVQVSA